MLVTVYLYFLNKEEFLKIQENFIKQFFTIYFNQTYVYDICIIWFVRVKYYLCKAW